MVTNGATEVWVWSSLEIPVDEALEDVREVVSEVIDPGTRVGLLLLSSFPPLPPLDVNIEEVVIWHAGDAPDVAVVLYVLVSNLPI